MKYPNDLSQNGTIGFVAPSFGCAIEPYVSAFNNAQKKFKELGYQIILGANAYEGQGIGISNTPEKCGEEWENAYLDRESVCLLSCGGGELMCEILDYIDFIKIAEAPPKWFMGYSDNTNLTYLLATLCDVASIYGPCAPAFGMEPWHFSLQESMNVLCGETSVVSGYEFWEKESRKTEAMPLVPYNVTERSNIRVFADEQAENISFRGRLLGGCMDCLVNLLGTKYDKTVDFIEKYQEDGIVWFLESCDLNVFAIRRAMWQMDHAGWFQNVKGFLIGRPMCIGQELMGLDTYQAVLEVAGKYNVPVIMDVDLGHLPPMMPIITGSIGEVTVRKENTTNGVELNLTKDSILVENQKLTKNSIQIKMLKV